LDDERGIELFEDVAILFEEEGEKLFDVVADDVHFEAFNDAGVFDGFVVCGEADNFLERQNVRAAEIKIGIGRREPVEVGAADGGEEERVRLGGGDARDAGVDC
jgi:hypothetical protein